MELGFLIKIVGLYLCRGISNLFNVFPIKKNRIVFYSFNGKSYSCNPRAITEYLFDMYSDECEFIWAFKKPEEFQNQVPKGVKCVKYRTLAYYYYVKTAKLVFFNVQGFGEISRRKKQIFVQTWHASNGYKKVSGCTGMKRKMLLLGHKDYSYVMSGAESMTRRRIRTSMNFSGEVIPGTPRMDMIINQNFEGVREKVCDLYQIDYKTNILLYAPTWRHNRDEEFLELDLERLHQTLCSMGMGEWVILVRFHPNAKAKGEYNLPYVKNVTKYPDMQELLCISSMLISDYSSCIWDYSFLYRPCFLYCYDLKQYYKYKDFDIPITEWGFPISQNMDELIEQIIGYKEDEFIKSMQEHHAKMGALEDGKALLRIEKLVRDNCL